VKHRRFLATSAYVFHRKFCHRARPCRIFPPRQDDSHAGRAIGLLAATAGAVAAIYLTVGHHWL
jgi:hypothetical protein